MKVRIHVSLKPGVLDPQGRAVHHALEDMCRKLLANTVIENFRIERLPQTESAA